MIYNVYCDESCHLENDRQKTMVLGAIWCPLSYRKEICKDIRAIKQNNGLDKTFEIKWTKISPGKLDFYIELVEYFFNNDNLHFRALIVPDKHKLKHEMFNQTHDTWYYKMYFTLLKAIMEPYNRYRIYIDIKDTQGVVKIKKLHEVLCNQFYDFSREIIERIQLIRSYESDIMQLTDLLIGAISYVNRDIKTSNAKLAVIERIKVLSGYSLTKSTLLRENKFNIFRWDAQEF